MRLRRFQTLALAGALSLALSLPVGGFDAEAQSFDLDTYGWCVALYNEADPLFLSNGSGIDAEQAERISGCMDIEPTEVLLGAQQHEPLDLWDAVDRHETAAALWSLEYDKADEIVQQLIPDVRRLWRDLTPLAPGWYWDIADRNIKKKPVRTWAVQTARDIEQAVASVEAYEFLPCMGELRTSMLERADTLAEGLQRLKGLSGRKAGNLIFELDLRDEWTDDSWVAECRNELMDWDMIRSAMEREVLDAEE